MARRTAKGAGHLPATQGRTPHIRAMLAGGKALPLDERGGVNRGIMTAPLLDSQRRAGGD